MVKQLLLIGSLLVPSLLQGVGNHFKGWVTYKEYEASEEYKKLIILKLEEMALVEENDNGTKKQKIEEAYVLEPDENGSIKVNGKFYVKRDYHSFCGNYYKLIFPDRSLENLYRHIEYVESLPDDEREIIKKGFLYDLFNETNYLYADKMQGFTFEQIVEGLALYEKAKDCKNDLCVVEKVWTCYFKNRCAFVSFEDFMVEPTEAFFKDHPRRLLNFDFCGDESDKCDESSKNNNTNNTGNSDNSDNSDADYYGEYITRGGDDDYITQY